MGYTKTDHYDGIIRRLIRSGRASNKTEVIHQALALLDAVTRHRGPSGSSFANADELEALLLDAGPAPSHDSGTQGQNLRGFETVKWQASLEVDEDLIEGRGYIQGDNDAAAWAFLNDREPSARMNVALRRCPPREPRSRLWPDNS